MNVYKKLQQARLKLQQAPLKKSGKNKFAGYEYFELADFLPTIQTIFAEVGLCGTVSFGTELATLTIVDVDATETTQPNFVIFSSPMSTAELKGCHAIQNLGAVQTYLRRYLWVAAMEIVEHDALDAVTGSDASKKAESTVTSPTSVDTKATWQHNKINCTEDPNDPNVWRQSFIGASIVNLGYCEDAKNIDAITSMFRVNKVSYERLKLESPEEYASLMLKFTETKNKIEEKLNGTSV